MQAVVSVWEESTGIFDQEESKMESIVEGSCDIA